MTKSGTLRSTWQAGLVAAGVAAIIMLMLGRPWPVGAPLYAAAIVGLLAARHLRLVPIFAFGISIGLSVAGIYLGYRHIGHVSVDLVVGAVVALAVAKVLTSRHPADRMYHLLIPVLTHTGTGVRAVASALRSGDVDAARDVVYALADTDADLLRLDREIAAMSRTSRWRLGPDKDVLRHHVEVTNEIRYAVRNLRVMARHAWWGVLHAGEPVPAALPHMLESLADAIGVLRDELAAEGSPHAARGLLVSTAHWIDVLRDSRLTLPTAAVAANADAAVLNLLIAGGTSLDTADNLIRRPLSVA